MFETINVSVHLIEVNYNSDIVLAYVAIRGMGHVLSALGVA